MNTELILWLIAGIVISEIIFVVTMLISRRNKGDDKSEWTLTSYLCDSWIITKFIALVSGVGFTFIQIMLVYHRDLDNNSFILSWGQGDWVVLLYEFLILAGIGLIFLINKVISDYINRK